MRLTAEQKKAVMGQFQRASNDTGSPEVQIALITTKVNELTEHLKQHKNDYHSRRGLIAMVSRRRNLLAYLKSQDEKLYSKIIKELSLRG